MQETVRASDMTPNPTVPGTLFDKAAAPLTLNIEAVFLVQTIEASFEMKKSTSQNRAYRMIGNAGSVKAPLFSGSEGADRLKIRPR